MVLSIRTISQSIDYKIEYQLKLSNNPVSLLQLDSKQLNRLILGGYAIDDNVRTLKEKYGNVHSIPAKKFLTKEEKLTLKER